MTDGLVYEIKQAQARCLVAVEGDTDRNRFVIGSLDLRGGNELYVLEFNEDTNEVACQSAFAHEGEIWHCATCPAPEHAELACTTASTGSEMRARLWVAAWPPAEHRPPAPKAAGVSASTQSWGVEFIPHAPPSTSRINV